MRVFAAAKVNLRLVVLAREATGYHQIETLFARTSLADVLTFEPSSGFGFDLIGAELGAPHDNLVVRAARAWEAAAGVAPAWRITLDKRIPAGAGLGGGSSDAAATLRTLDRLHDDALGSRRLLELAAQLGSDVPFFLLDAPYALAWGRGERMLAFDGPAPRPGLIVVPPVPIATAEAYSRLAPRQPAAPLALHRAQLTTWDGFSELATNDFESVARDLVPLCGDALDTLRRTAATVAMLSGSGSALFAVFDDVVERDQAQRTVAAAHPVCIQHSVDIGC